MAPRSSGWLLTAGSPFVFLGIALLVAVTQGTPSTPSAASRAALDSWHALASLIVVSSLLQSIGEEPGWRGYLLGKLRGRRSALSATLVLFPLWLLWHMPIFLARPEFGWGQFAGFSLGILSAAVWLTAIREWSGSTFAAIVWHALINFTRGIALSVSTVAFLSLRTRGHDRRHSHRDRDRTRLCFNLCRQNTQGLGMSNRDGSLASASLQGAQRRRLVAVACALAAAATSLAPLWAQAAGATTDQALKRAHRVLAKSILVDGHNDLPIAIRNFDEAPSDLDAYDLRKTTPGQTDLARLKAGHVGAQFWSVYIPSEGRGPFARVQLEQIELTRRLIARYPEAFRFAGSVAEIRAARRAGRIASLLGIEGGQAIENSLGALRAYYDLGVRYMSLTHNSHTDWADAAQQVPARHGGLTPFGEEVVREMNRLGMLVDLAHASPATMADALRVTAAPVIWSHAAARGICDVPRNVPDDILRELPKNGGVVMVTFVAGFIDCEVAKVTQPFIMEMGMKMRAAASAEERRQIYKDAIKQLQVPPTSIALVADHIEHIRSVAGIDHLGIGGDFDGNSWWPTGLSDVSMYPNLFAELVRRGWKDADLRKLAGENVLRAMSEAERVAARLRKERSPSLAALGSVNP
jgi:membrane dipeptidase